MTVQPTAGNVLLLLFLLSRQAKAEDDEKERLQSSVIVIRACVDARDVSYSNSECKYSCEGLYDHNSQIKKKQL